ncbi:DUF3299 domain-containing protein [Tropicimonas marinistellae]|uniref:DUF3299 domain-containing protein n=1 Tax=Tropicimonas marinistellae TaxID=1739787 RepID=UPI001F3D1BCA|nr:DUF3299 domain-containing protein [Tropicimonas marinistellae]
MKTVLGRRPFLRLCMAPALAAAVPLRASEEVIEIDWADLIPSETDAIGSAYETLGIIGHDQISAAPADPGFAPVTDAYTGKQIRIPGYVVPLEYLSTGVTSFLLVPYVGACIHVPPPPSNQLILVDSAEPQEFSGLFEPVYVTGTLGTTAAETDLADVGYFLRADIVEPYTFDAD